MKGTLNGTYLAECLKQARYYEYCKDAERAMAILHPIWEDIEEPPKLDGLPERAAWEVLMLCGNLISIYGMNHQIKHYKELATDTLTEARDRAIAIGERDVISETEKQMAVVYWRHGQFENAIAFLNTVLSRYSEAEQLTNRICLLAQANLLLLYVSTNEINTAFEICQKIKPFVDDSEDLWLKTTFYNQAAGIYVFVGKFKHAIPLLERCVDYATRSKNNAYLGNALNNLANAYLNVPDTGKATEYVDKAIELYLSINQIFLYSLALETKAQVRVVAGDFEQALKLIDESIGILQKGENYGELCESLWTRTLILAKTGDKMRAVQQFTDLIRVSNENLNLVTSNRYTEQFSRLLYLPTGQNLEEKERNFRSFLLDEALSKCGGIVTATANYLGVIHQTLSIILKKFPELCEKHQVKLRTRTAARLPKTKSADKPETPADSFSMRLQSNRLDYLGLPKGTIIKINRRSVAELDLSKPVVVKDTEQKYHCGYLVEAFGMFSFEDGRGTMERTFLPSEITEAGQIIAVFDEIKDEFTALFED